MMRRIFNLNAQLLLTYLLFYLSFSQTNEQFETSLAIMISEYVDNQDFLHLAWIF